jgi:hypothetical protein
VRAHGARRIGVLRDRHRRVDDLDAVLAATAASAAADPNASTRTPAARAIPAATAATSSAPFASTAMTGERDPAPTG